MSRLVPDSWGSFREHNTCHDPKTGEFCSLADVPLYHGTLAGKVKRILNEGLVTGNKANYAESHPEFVYLTKSKMDAVKWAEGAANLGWGEVEGQGIAVIEFTMPARDAHMGWPDYNFWHSGQDWEQADNLQFPDYVAPEYITRAWVSEAPASRPFTWHAVKGKPGSLFEASSTSTVAYAVAYAVVRLFNPRLDRS